MNYEIISNSLYGSKIKKSHKDGIEILTEEWAVRGFKDIRWFAYILATVYHETAGHMHPIKEGGGEIYLRNKPYYPYYGRDLVQTTWKGNYEKVKKFTGVDVVTNPDLISDPRTAAKTAIEFMNRGWYTGKKLAHYFNDKVDDPLNARRIINGLDKAKHIADIYQIFYKALIN